MVKVHPIDECEQCKQDKREIVNKWYDENKETYDRLKQTAKDEGKHPATKYSMALKRLKNEYEIANPKQPKTKAPAKPRAKAPKQAKTPKPEKTPVQIFKGSNIQEAIDEAEKLAVEAVINKTPPQVLMQQVAEVIIDNNVSGTKQEENIIKEAVANAVVNVVEEAPKKVKTDTEKMLENLTKMREEIKKPIEYIKTDVPLKERTDLTPEQKGEIFDMIMIEEAKKIEKEKPTEKIIKDVIAQADNIAILEEDEMVVNKKDWEDLVNRIATRATEREVKTQGRQVSKEIQVLAEDLFDRYQEEELNRDKKEIKRIADRRYQLYGENPEFNILSIEYLEEGIKKLRKDISDEDVSFGEFAQRNPDIPREGKILADTYNRYKNNTEKKYYDIIKKAYKILTEQLVLALENNDAEKQEKLYDLLSDLSKIGKQHDIYLKGFDNITTDLKHTAKYMNIAIPYDINDVACYVSHYSKSIDSTEYLKTRPDKSKKELLKLLDDNDIEEFEKGIMSYWDDYKCLYVSKFILEKQKKTVPQKILDNIKRLNLSLSGDVLKAYRPSAELLKEWEQLADLKIKRGWGMGTPHLKPNPF